MQDRSTDRINALTHFVNQHVNGVTAIEPASADASFRRYFRVEYQDGTLIVMDAPPEKEDTGPFIDVAQRLTAVDINAPKIIAADVAQGFLILTDLGSRTLLPELNAQTVDEYYSGAMQVMLQMQLQAQVAGLPLYDESLLQQEMSLMPTWFLDVHLAYTCTDNETEMLAQLFDELVANAQAQPQRFVHRDYHSRNLMLAEGALPAVIDFQDAVNGPITYDLVSLLKDCYIEWPRERVLSWVEQYWADTRAQGLHDVELPAFVRWFDLMGLQRHIKVIGIFARLYHRDGKDGYLNDLPLTLKYIVDTAALYPECGAFYAWMTETIMPLFTQVQGA